MSDESSSSTQGQIRPGPPLTMTLIGFTQMIFISLLIYLIWGEKIHIDNLQNK